MQKNCPVCAAPGQDLAFTFECTNPDCQNFALGPQDSECTEEDDLDGDGDGFFPGYYTGACD